MASGSGIDPISHVADAFEFEIFPTSHTVIPVPFGISKFQLLVLLAAIIVFIAYVWLARRVASGEPPKGRLWNFLESILLFIRDEVVRPSIGEHDYKKFLPYLWTLFLFILVMNLLGMIPFMGSPTASLAVTIALALVSFAVAHYNGVVANHGFVGYMKTFIPHIDTNDPIMRWMGPPLMVGLFFIEVFGAFVRGAVLAIRLFANMLAGHTALVVVLSFIVLAGQAGTSLFWPITGASVVMVTLLSLLELFVACLQAFIFTFLTAIFIGIAMHPQH
jgi:F-type H+-transporting ATPase subunit a